tara:strand:+ start:5818 stop:6102 length:285 start_codon:yes stop_codon:yes gene_type:complete
MAWNRSLLLLIVIFIVSCVGTINSPSAKYPNILPPAMPKAVLQPEIVWAKCGDDYMCLLIKDFDELKKFIQDYDRSYRKNYCTIKIINGEKCKT